MKTLANAMTTTLQTIQAKANIIAASQEMRDRHVGSLVVIRQGRTYEGPGGRDCWVDY